ncbi:hypothetical protein FHS89_000708 [Rubricella aquisinus]|uniref:Uncharacterized protein n=1 Tax=Rubricella aquisinus TaxID=2028108 RepID=A0A840WM23_9RHOB|nr:hypothetical protein [Rubricella aquisinus]MBB5514702.1 hypothetical protein [Rubricella aquisinus]
MAHEGKPAVTLHFTVSPGDAPHLTDVICLLNETSAEITLGEGHPAELAAEVVSALAPHLDMAKARTNYQVRDFRLDLGAFWLDGLSIQAERSTVTVSFRYAGGNPLAIFAPINGARESAIHDLARAVDDAIERLYVPLVNLDTALDAVMDVADEAEIMRLHREILSLKSDIEAAKFGFERALRDGTGDRLRKITLEARHDPKP